MIVHHYMLLLCHLGLKLFTVSHEGQRFQTQGKPRKLQKVNTDLEMKDVNSYVGIMETLRFRLASEAAA